MGRAGALLALARWPNALISAAAVLVGAWYAAERLTAATWLAAAAGALLTAFANADNDVGDAELDRIAHPTRPLPSGEVDASVARAMAAAAAVSGIALAAAASPALGVASVAVVATMAAYNRVGVRHAALKNVTVAVLASLPFVYGAVTVDAAMRGVALAAVGAPLHFARELAKDLDDAAADAATRRTLPVVAGARATVAIVWIAVAVFAVAIWSLGRSASGGRGVVLLPALALALVAATRAGPHRRPRAAALFKSAMLAAMAGAITLRAI